MRKPIFTGVCTALVTPFLEGKVNFPMLKILLRRQIDAGVPAIAVTGTTGEAATLTEREKLDIWQESKNYTAGGCILIAGTGSNSTAEAIHLSQKAEQIGVDGLLVVSPYYNKATEDGLFAHYLAIAHSVNIPIILYNVPSRTGVDIPIEVYRRLSRIPNIIGVKEASADITKIPKIRNACEKDFSIWTGNDELTVPSMVLGGQGVISVTANICPDKIVTMTDYANNEDYVTAGKIQTALQPLNDLMFCEVNPIPVKDALNIMGYDCGSCRLPLCGISKANHIKLKSFFGSEP